MENLFVALKHSAMQIGKKQNDTGWEVYDSIIVRHTFLSRTKKIENQIVDPEWSKPIN